MSYEVIKTINGNEYRYEQETYRDEHGKVRTRNRYIGPVRRKRGLMSALLGGLKEQLKTKKIWELTPEQEAAMLEKVEADRVSQERINDILSGRSFTLAELDEVIEYQNPGNCEDTPEEAEAIRAEVEAVPEFAPKETEPEGSVTDTPESSSGSEGQQEAQDAPGAEGPTGSI